jgi:hypothetical protein
MRGETRSLPTVVITTLIVVTGGAVEADVYRWADERGEVHYSHVPDHAPAGAVAPPTAAARRTPVAGTAAGQGEVAEAPVAAPASLDIERYQLQGQYREAKARLAAIDEQLRVLAAADAAAPEAGEDAVVDLETRSAKEIALQRQRREVTKQLDGVRARYADLCREAARAHGGEPPAGWEQDLE